MAKQYFRYGDEEIEYLKSKDKKLAWVIEKIGPLQRPVESDLYSSVVHHIIGQQISTKAQETIWRRLLDLLGCDGSSKDIKQKVTADVICSISDEKLQSIGITFKKAEYIKDFSSRVRDGSFDLEKVERMTDGEAIEALSGLKGIGVWTAEMLLLFCLQRPDILSYGDLAIRRGMRMVYRHRELDKSRFEKYRRRLSPYCSVASLYFWAVAGGAIPELTDPAPKSKKKQ